MAIPLFINGKEVDSSLKFSYTNNASGATHKGDVSAATPELLKEAIDTAQVAFGPWKALPAFQRRDIINKFGDILATKQEFFSKLYAKETPVEPIVAGTDFAYAMGHVREAAGVCTQVVGDLPQTLDGSTALVLREPYGVVFSMVPFNFALTLTLRTLLYPLACGNTVVVKGNERIPESILEVVKMFKEAGLPDGVLNLVQFTPETVASSVESIISNRAVRCVNFTGSAVVGKIVASLCGKHSKPILLELGGKAPAIVLPDADIATAANNILFAAVLHAGQICMSTEVVYAVGSETKQKLQTEITTILKDPSWTKLGDFEMISPEAATKLRGLWKDAFDKGAKLLTPGSLEPGKSPVGVKAAVFADVKPNMRLYTEESFGPSVSIIEVASVDEAITAANSSEYGLSASVWTKDYFEAIEIAKKIESGAVHINSITVHDEAGLPHGGYKGSGFGRFNGAYAIQSFTQTKSITLKKPSMMPLFLLQGAMG